MLIHIFPRKYGFLKIPSFLTNHIYGEPEPTYPAGVLPDPSPALKRRGSAYRSMKKKKDKSKPYPKRKGSFRRFAGGEDDD